MLDRFQVDGPPDQDETPRPVWQKLAWFVGLACVSMLTIASVAYLLRALLFIG